MRGAVVLMFLCRSVQMGKRIKPRIAKPGGVLVPVGLFAFSLAVEPKHFGRLVHLQKHNM